LQSAYSRPPTWELQEPADEELALQLNIPLQHLSSQLQQQAVAASSGSKQWQQAAAEASSSMQQAAASAAGHSVDNRKAMFLLLVALPLLHVVVEWFRADHKDMRKQDQGSWLAPHTDKSSLARTSFTPSGIQARNPQGAHATAAHPPLHTHHCTPTFPPANAVAMSGGRLLADLPAAASRANRAGSTPSPDTEHSTAQHGTAQDTMKPLGSLHSMMTSYVEDASGK
jgi:hypothetical protein